jgi:hypothetical protein
MDNISSLSHAGLPSPRSQSPCTTSSGLFGWLKATPDSFLDLTLPIAGPATSWGRNINNTIVYTDEHDTRVPKIAFLLYLYEDTPAEAKSASCKAAIYTHATSGISVNGKHLKRRDKNGDMTYGRLKTGDIISIYHKPLSTEVLKFKCFLSPKVVGRRRGFTPIVHRPKTKNQQPTSTLR